MVVVVLVIANVSASITSSRTSVDVLKLVVVVVVVVVGGGGGSKDAATTEDARLPATIQHFLCFFPEPQGHFSLGFVFFGGMIDGFDASQSATQESCKLVILACYSSFFAFVLLL